MTRKIAVLLLALLMLMPACAKKAERDISTPEKSLTTLLSAMYLRDADAFIYCMTDEQLTAYGNSRDSEIKRLKQSMRRTKGKSHPPSEFEITKRLESKDKNKVRIEFQLKKEFLKEFDGPGWKGAHIFVKTRDGWKSSGVDVFRDGRWLYTREDPFKPKYE